MAQIIRIGGKRYWRRNFEISHLLGNSYVLNFIKFGGKRTTAAYFEPAFFALALISIWLTSNNSLVSNTEKRCYDSGRDNITDHFQVMTFILFLPSEWAFQYWNKDAIKKNSLALVSLTPFLVSNYCISAIATRPGDLGTKAHLLIIVLWARYHGRWFLDPY